MLDHLRCPIGELHSQKILNFGVSWGGGDPPLPRVTTGRGPSLCRGSLQYWDGSTGSRSIATRVRHGLTVDPSTFQLRISGHSFIQQVIRRIGGGGGPGGGGGGGGVISSDQFPDTGQVLPCHCMFVSFTDFILPGFYECEVTSRRVNRDCHRPGGQDAVLITLSVKWSVCGPSRSWHPWSRGLTCHVSGQGASGPTRSACPGQYVVSIPI